MRTTASSDDLIRVVNLVLNTAQVLFMAWLSAHYRRNGKDRQERSATS